MFKEGYGLKQAPRAWNKRFHSIPAYQDFSRCVVDFGVYVLMTGTNKKEIDDLRRN